MKKQTESALNFLHPPIPVNRGAYIPYFKINPPIFYPLFSQPSAQDQQNGKQSHCWLPSHRASQLNSRIHPLIFLWTHKGFISPESFLNFFLHLYIPSWLQKSFKFIVLRLLAKNWICSFLKALRQNSPPGYHYPPGRRKLPILHNSVFWRPFFPSKKRGRIMELEKLPKLNLQGYLPLVLMNSTIFTIFKFSVSVLLCHNLASTMLKCGGSLT